ncbi:MAG: Nudix family hydrolase [Betaproteobacteria bacterium]|nr:Nudix family hydrolase [Betaproteobacteria bacterium]
MKVTHVAAAVFLRPDGAFLLAQRPDGKPYPGYWEFPGGKVEPGESAHDCLVREIREELDVEVLDATPWIVRVHAYTHATVRLNFFRVTRWQGEFRGMEGQAHVWQDVRRPSVSPMLPANTPVFRALAVPDRMAISNVAALGLREYSLRLERALQSGLRWLVLREPDLPDVDVAEAARELGAKLHAVGGTLLLSSRHDATRIPDIDGIHLTSRDLMASSARPEGARVTASCHTREDIAHADALGLDAVVAGPVLATASHPGASLGWEAFADLVRDPPLPVFALGGLAAGDVAQAQALGAQGVAYQRSL